MPSIRAPSWLGVVSVALAGSCTASRRPPTTLPPSQTAAAPGPSSQPAGRSGPIVHVQIRADGATLVDGKREPNLDAVAAQVEQGHGSDLSSLQVVLKADGSAAAARVIAVVDRLKRDGIRRFSFGVVEHEATPAPAAGPIPSASSSAETRPDAGPPAPSLPEVSVHNVGLHIGGGPNDDASKRPFREAIEPHFDDFLKCYRQVERPEKGGTFGVDLYVGRHGGKPEVRQPRTIMKGKAFRDCMLQVFSSIEFHRPEKPTVISYSLRFEIANH